MIKTIKRIINWTGERKKRLYIGSIYSFFNAIFIAMPIMAVVYIFQMILMQNRGEIEIPLIDVWYVTGFMVLMVLGRFLMSYFRALNQDSIAYEVTAEERLKIGKILKRVSLGFFEKNNAGELTTAITSDLSYLEMYSMKMIDIVVNGYISAAVMIIFLMIYNIWVGLIAIIGMILSALALKLIGYTSRKNSKIHELAQEKMIKAVIEYVRGIPTAKAFAKEGIVTGQIKKAFAESKRINIKIEKNFVPNNCLHLLSLRLTSAGIVFSVAIFALNGKMDIATMMMFVVFSFVIFGQVETISNAVHVLSMIDATMDKVDAIKKVRYIDEKGKNIVLKKHDIQFKNVTFKYDSQPILKKINFKINPDTTTAIVGPSGSGKTTICSLMARFYDVDSGEILIGGINIKKMNCDSILENMSMVFQKVYLFHDTILNNIKFGRPDARKEDIIEIAKKARCHEFISNLPMGYETMIGEGGSTLSGGEKQRISIARAMLKDAPIIILDEATANIDPENEQEIQGAISELVKGKTIIIIAHRLATIENADQILVVDQGKIVQRGVHDQLIKEKGVYKRFIDVRSQAEGWRL
jgi:ATP-binding cassette subfamily B protein